MSFPLSRPLSRLALGLALAAACASDAAFAQDAPPAQQSQPPAPNAAEDAAPPERHTTEQAADAAVTAFQAKDAPKLKALAAADDPDPWLVADELLSRGAPDAADAFARAAPRPAVEALPAYVTKCRTLPRRPDARALEARAGRLIEQGRPGDAIAELDAEKPRADLPAVPAVTLLRLRGEALSLLERGGDSIAAFRAAADGAEAAGWLAGAVACRKRAFGVAQSAGDLPVMQDEWGRIAGLYERLGDLPGRAKAMLNVGALASMRGDYVGAMHEFERAAEAFARAGDTPALRPALGRLLDNQGLVAQWLGHYSDAYAYFGRSCDILRATGDGARLAHALANFGELHCGMGAWPEDVACATESFRLAQDAGDDGTAATASACLGFALRALRRFEDAETAQRRAHVLYLKAGDNLNARLTEVELSDTLKSAGRVREASVLLEAAIADLAQSPDRRLTLVARLALATVHLEAGRAEDALNGFNSGAAEASSMSLTSLELNALRGAAAAQARLGRQRDAAGSAWRALLLARTQASGLAATQLTGLRSDPPRDFDEVAIGVAAACAVDDADLLCRFLEEGRAGAVLVSLAEGDAAKLREATVRPELRAEEAKLRDAQAAARRRLDVAVGAGDLVTIRAERQRVDAANAAVVAVVERIHVESRLGASFLYPDPAGLAAIRALLGPRDALVAFTATSERCLALVTTREGARIVKLGAPAALAAACAALDATRPGRATADAGAALRAQVLEPLALGADVQRLIVVPDGPLTAVPFALLLPELEIVYLPSATTYVLLQPQRELRGTGVLAFGDPDLGPAPASGTRGGSGVELGPLPNAREEARAIGDRVRVGHDASEAALRATLAEAPAGGVPRRWRAVHFACHGLVDVQRPWNSALILASGGGHDGRLTALDVVGLDFRADLVALSACDTARGEIVRGDGVVGLPRAFLVAGAPRVLVSLWKVDDEATAVLMRKFHALWKEGGVTAARALRDAQAAIRSEARWKDPYYWAGWELWGLSD